MPLLCSSFLLMAQVNYNANTTVTPYTQGFHHAANNGYFPGWINEQIGQMSAGSSALNIPGTGTRAMRVGFNEEIAELFGYDILDGLFQQYTSLGMKEHTMILGYPIDWHRDPNSYCGDPNKRSAMFKGMYLPVWDGGANGTPYNDDNYLAVYTYKMVSRYKNDIRFWEIWNEPGFDLTFSKGWLPPNQPGNWWQNDPLPCDIVLYAPVQHYVRTLRVSYDIIKTLDPDSYVTASGLGYPSFLDAILRNTDNPNGGGVTAEYPLKGGAYFDAVGFHSYPHFDGSVRYYDLALNQMVDARHSDGAADGTIRVWQGYETVLNSYGYNGTTFPQKIKMITEGNIPRKAFDVGTPNESLGGTEVQRNYAIKNMVQLMKNNFAQYDIYQLFENKTLAQGIQPYDVMGLYEMPTALGVIPARTEHAIATHTASQMLYRTTYNAARTAAMNLPANVGGAAFLNPNGKYVYAIWAKTQTDKSEFASANYSFPAALGLTTLTRRNWDFGQTNASSAQSPSGIALTSAPIFLTDDTAWPPATVTPTNKVDLALSMSASPINPIAGQNYTWSLTITNSSANNATGVEVGSFMEFSKQFILDRITYVSHAAPAGTTYEPLNGRWVIGSVPAGQSRTLTVTTKAVHGGIYKTFGQVSKCDQQDVDSAPLNGQAIKTPFEDDEAFFIVNNNGFIDTKADWVVEATNYPATANAGAAIPCNFMMRNNGRVGGAGTTTTIYLSTDALFSPNDQFLTFTTVLPMVAFGYDLKNITLNLPTGLTSGTYYLLFHADFGTQVDEADENNVFARSIIINGGTPVCALNASVSNAVCNNAGTPNNAADDTWTFNLTVTGSNTGTSGWTANVAGQTITGTYGTPKSVSGGLISAGVRVFAVGDITTPACTTNVSATPPASCSTPNPCTISAVVSNITCQNPGTADPNDDTYIYTLTVTGTNVSNSWVGNNNGNTFAGAYNTPNVITAGYIGAGVQNFTVADQVNLNCSTNVTVNPPPSCSGANPGTYCASKGDAPWEEWIGNVQVGTGSQASTKTQYSDFTSKIFTVQNGTAVSLTTQFSYTTNDEYWRIWIDLNNDNDFIDAGEQVFEGIGLKPANALNATKTTTGSITLPANAPSANRRMRVAMKRGAFPTPCETFAFGEVEDYTAAVSGGGNPPVCSLNASVSNAVCNNANTPNNPADDTWTFNLTVTGTNAGATGWTATVAGQTVTGTYGAPKTVSGGLISAGVLVFAVGDITTPTCTTNVSATPPATCSTPNPCSINAVVSNITCNDNGTPTITTDDTYGFTVLVTGTNTSSGWQVLGPNGFSGTYGVPKVVTGVGFASTTLTLTAQDLNSSTCSTTFVVTAPLPCSNPNPGTYCASKGDAPWQEWISEVRIGTGTQVSSKTQYSDFTSKVFAVQNGTAVNLTTQFSWETTDQYWRIWIDLNNDNDFIDAGEQVFEGIGLKPANALNATKTTTGSIILPANAPTANRRMRVAMKRGAFPTPCETFAFGEVEDYTAAVTGGGNPPVCAIGGVVNIGICNNNGTPNISNDDLYNFDFIITGTNTSTGWTATGASAQSGTYGVAKVFNNVLISAGTLTYQVRDNANATCTTTITVVPPASCSNPNPPGAYCVSKGNFPWEDWIGNVKVGLTNRPSQKEGYLDNTSQAALLITPNTSIELTANFSWFTYDEYWRVWIDLNRDGDFIDAGEQVFQAIGTAPLAGANMSRTVSGVLPFPTTLPAGSTRMRVAMKRGAYATPCETFLNGEVEDYTVTFGINLLSSRPEDLATAIAPRATKTVLTNNPTDNWTSLRFEEPTSATAKVYIVNQMGKLVEAERYLVIGTEEVEFFVGHLAKGMYFVHVQVEGERGQVHRLVVLE
jgi:hypothetical protein